MNARIGIVGLAFLAACGKDATAPVSVTSVRMLAPSGYMIVGDSMLLTAVLRDAQSNVLSGRLVTWASGDPSAATVRAVSTNTAMVASLKPGNVAIVAASEGMSASYTVSITGPVAKLELSPGEVRLIVGTVYPLTVRVTDADKNVVPGRTISYTSSDPTVATVSASGNVGAVSVGSCTITATSDGKSAAANVVVLPVPPPPPSHAFLWTAAGGVRELNAPAGYSSSFAMSINATGQVAGSSSRSDGTGNTTHAVRWSAAAIAQDLGALPGGSYSAATAINALGAVAGIASISTGINAPTHAVLWSPSGDILDLGTLSTDVSSAAFGINDAGQVVGASYGANNSTRAFVWTAATGMRDLGAARASANATNRAGDIVGVSNGQPFKQPGASSIQRNLGLLRGDVNGVAYSINDAGDAVGANDRQVLTSSYYYYGYYDVTPHAVLWMTDGNIVDLGAVPGIDPSNSYAYGLNNSGQVVGQSGNRAFLWSRAGGYVNLGAIIGRLSSVARGVNDAGQVVGSSK